MTHVFMTVDYPTVPLITPLVSKGFRVTVAGTKKEFLWLKKSGCQFLKGRHFWYPSNQKRVCEIVTQFKNSLSSDQRLCLDGQDCLDSFSNRQWDILEKDLSQVLDKLILINRLHQEHPIHLIIVHNEIDALAEALLCFSREKNIPSLQVPHASWLIHIVNELANPHSLPQANYQVFAGSYSAARYKDFLKEDTWAITGNPEFDTYRNYSLQKKKEEGRAQLKLTDQKPVISFFSSAGWNGLIERDAIENAIEHSYKTLLLASRSHNFQLICKLHSASDDKRHKQVEDDLSIGPFLRTKEHLDACLAAPDWLVVFGSSNVVIEAVLAGQKVIVIDGFQDQVGVHAISSHPDTISATLQKAISGQLDAFYTKEAREDFIKNYNVDNNGGATNRVVTFIEKILDKNHSTQTNYFGVVRPELANKVPLDSQVILELGCGQGLTAALIRTKLPWTKIIGIEKHEDSVKKAKNVFDEVHCHDLSKIELSEIGLKEKEIDCLIYGDVLEHLEDPWSTLKNHVQYLSDRGTVVISIPNVACITVFDQLRKGRWPYQEDGIFDHTHLRFFTRQSLLQLLEDSGLTLETMERVKAIHLPQKKGIFNITWPHFSLKRLSREEIEDLETEQFIVTAKKSSQECSRKTPVQLATNTDKPLVRVHKKLYTNSLLYQKIYLPCRRWLWRHGLSTYHPSLQEYHTHTSWISRLLKKG